MTHSYRIGEDPGPSFLTAPHVFPLLAGLGLSQRRVILPKAADRSEVSRWFLSFAAESLALADGLFNAADPKPNADFIFVRLFRVDRADQTQSQQAGGNSACVQR
jgi:hypothetical protein